MTVLESKPGRPKRPTAANTIEGGSGAARLAGRLRPDGSRDWLADSEPLIAGIVLAALGFRQILHTELTSGDVLALFTAPLWVPKLRRYAGARLFIGLGLITVAWGVILPKLSATHLVSGTDRNNTVVLLLGLFAGVGVILWARTLMPISRILIWYGAGMLMGGAAGFVAPAGNAWKFVWAMPLAVFLLGWAARTGRRSSELMVLLLLMLLSGAFDSRSYLGTYGLTAVLTLWQCRPQQASRRVHWVFNAGLLAAMAWSTYYVGTTLLVSGYLGRDAQVRSVAQIQQAGSLILGGRPELEATFALMRRDIAGFGAGVQASPLDVLAAKNGMAKIGYAANNGYVDKFMFGKGIELHSTFGDLWAWFGLAGLAFVAAVIFVVVRGLASALAHNRASAGLLCVSIWTIWNVGFSPFYAAEPTLMLALGFAFLLKRRGSPRPGSPAAAGGDATTAEHQAAVHVGSGAVAGER